MFAIILVDTVVKKLATQIQEHSPGLSCTSEISVHAFFFFKRTLKSADLLLYRQEYLLTDSISNSPFSIVFLQ